ncbi:MAG TPA: phospholipase D-like domain-containing protein [Candidatus Cloacimonadota bacterium]|nr:phospholipase D-like domain-containing protein [Candidatus Cloacimonadota bacterium]
MSTLLPTINVADWSVTQFKDSFMESLTDTAKYDELRLYFYAISLSGWRYVRQAVLRWKNSKGGRVVVVYVGTDHGITGADALEEMMKDDIEIRVLLRYNGVFHPKVAWFLNNDHHSLVLVGSNNLTESGLLQNIEFATITEYVGINDGMIKWHEIIHEASSTLDDDLLSSYTSELNKHNRDLMSQNKGNFVWSRKSKLGRRRSKSQTIQDYGIQTGNLILEITPRETGPNGNQIQIPMGVATKFFHLPLTSDSSITVDLKNTTTDETRALTITRYSNKTARLSIYELSYRDRPCVMILDKIDSNHYNFEIVSEVTNPDKYHSLMRLCTNQRRVGSRRWELVK